MKKRLLLSLILITSLLFFTYAGSALSTDKPAKSKPPVSGEIVTDQYGNPTIHAGTNDRLFELLGYWTAKVQLWGLEFSKRDARGTLAEILGPTYLTSDKNRRLMGYTEKEYDSIFNSLLPETQEILQAYVRGINLRIDEVMANPDELLPYEFKKLGIEPSRWVQNDPLARTSATYRQFGVNGGTELANLQVLQKLMAKYDTQTAWGMFNDFYWVNDPEAPTYIDKEMEWDIAKTLPNVDEAAKYAKKFTNVEKASEELAQIRHSGEELGIPMFVDKASFAYGILPKRTATGNAMLKADPQSGYGPNLFNEVQLRGGAGFDAGGYVRFGSPSLTFGRTKYVAWTYMVGMGDNVDIYAENLNPANHEQYLFNGKWTDMEKRLETIEIAGKPPVTMTIYRTIHGPVVSPNPFDPNDTTVTQVYSWKFAHWLLDAKTVEAQLAMMRARDVQDMLNICENVFFSVHILSGGTKGNIGYCMAGRVPIRPLGTDFRLPLVGDGSMEWTGEFKKMPMALNPKKGFITGWNNKSSPGYNNPDNNYFGKYHRALWLERALKHKRAITFEDMLSITQMTMGGVGSPETGIMIKDVLPYISKAIKAVPPSDPYYARLNEALAILSTWDGLSMDDVKASTVLKVPFSIFGTWLPLMIKDTFQDEFQGVIDFGTYSDKAFNVLLRAWDGFTSPLPVSRNYFDDITTPVVETSDDIVLKSMKEAIDKLTLRFGTPIMSQWVAPRPRTQIVNAVIGVIGNFPAVNSGTYSAVYDFNPKGMVGLSRWVYGSSGFIGMNESGDPVYDDPHLFDMLNLFVNYEYQPIFLEK